ncbi:MAG TPA: MFS transporter [Bacteroidia bacterium]|nr:MFS transporter [Bacteroidia bacterium]HNT80163.1 MFS transporter [Bacteroidia bacterium]
MSENKIHSNPFNTIVIVAALGYFVDIYDLVLFGIVRTTSLQGIGITNPNDLLNIGASLLNWQMSGMLVGGILWGILGDKKGRLSVLFGSIIMYSLANIANGFVQDVNTYSALRFIAGIGLAGELGAGITLVSETMTKQNRGYGTMLVAAIGISGAVVANLVAGQFDWRISYFVGGAMGLALLLLRIGVYESGMFSNIKTETVNKGNFLYLFKNKKRALKYLSVIAVAIPVWYVVGILMIFSPELGKSMGMKKLPVAGDAIMYCYIGITLGDFGSGLLSQLIKSRKKAIGFFMAGTILFTILYFLLSFSSLFMFYLFAGCVGFCTGYWAVFMTTASEQFGTNIRATVTTTAPNFVRGSVVLITLGFQYFNSIYGSITSAIIIGVFVFTIGIVALYNIEESFHKELDYIE